MKVIELSSSRGMPLNILGIPFIPIHDEILYRNIGDIIIAIGINKYDKRIIVDSINVNCDVHYHEINGGHFIVYYKKCIFEENKLLYFDKLSDKIVYLRKLKIKKLKTWDT